MQEQLPVTNVSFLLFFHKTMTQIQGKLMLEV